MKKNINKIAICSLLAIAFIAILIKVFYVSKCEEDLTDILEGYYELDSTFKELSQSESNSIIIKQDCIEFILEDSPSSIISLDYTKILKEGFTVKAFVDTSSEENHPLGNINMILSLDLVKGILTMKSKDVILGVYIKDNMITNII